MAERGVTVGVTSAPRNAVVGSFSARAVAMAYRNTLPMALRCLRAVSCTPRTSTSLRTASTSRADISLIARAPIAGCATTTRGDCIPRLAISDFRQAFDLARTLA
jgi:hypothetical protein